MKKLIWLSALSVTLNACAWVGLTPEGAKTRVLSASEVSSCTKVGTTTANMTSKVIGVKRDEEKVRKELEVLARNAATNLKGDTVVPVSEPENGQQVFEVYRCVGP